MKVSEVIDQLKVGDEVWVRGVVDVVYQGLHPSINIREAGWFSKNTEISLTEPKNEKVEVPDFVAPFIEKLKTTGRRYGVELEKAYASGEDADLSEWLWFNENVLTVFKALENGYTVKKESRWVVKDSDGEFIYDLHLCGVDTTTFSSNTTKGDDNTVKPY